MNSEIAALAKALQAANAVDIEFSEETFLGHPETGERVAFHPVKVLGIAIPRPSLALYIRARDSKGIYWYVLEWSSADAPDLGIQPMENVVVSEQTAKELVLRGLRRAYITAKHN